MDLSKLSDAELKQIAKGDLRMLPVETLQQLAGVDPYKQEAEARSTFGKVKAGLASAPINLYLGTKQLFGELSPIEQDVLKQNRAAESAAPVTSIASNVATMAPTMFIPGVNTVAGAGLLGAGMGAVQPVIEGESRLQNAVLGGAFGAGGQKLGQSVGRLLAGRQGMAGAQPVMQGAAQVKATGGGFNYGSVGSDMSAGINATQQRALQQGQKLGLQFTPGQATGSKVLQQLESKLESQPMTSGKFFEIKDNNQKILNSLAAKSIGETADVIDDTVLSTAKERISNVYKLVADQNPRPINPDDFLGKVARIENEFEGLLPANQPSLLDNVLVKQAFKLAENGQATGEQLQALASKLGKAATNQMTSANGDRQVGMALGKVKDVVDDLLESGLKGQTRDVFAKARSEYRNLMMLTARKGVVSESGDINPRSLANVLFSKDKSGYAFGKNNSDLYKALKSVQAFPSVVPNSGTATRSVLPSPTDFVLSLPFNLATKAYTSAPAMKAATSAGRIAEQGIAPSTRPIAQYLPPLGGLLGMSLPTQE